MPQLPADWRDTIELASTKRRMSISATPETSQPQDQEVIQSKIQIPFIEV